MNKTKLPKMIIIRSLTDSPEIKEYKSKMRTWLSYALLLLVLCTIIPVIFILNVHNEGRIIAPTPVQKQNVVLESTASIIVREGGISPDLAKQYATWIYESSIKWAIDPVLVLSVMAVESRFDYKAISSSGAIGLMQVIPSYHKDKVTKTALFDPKTSIDVGTQIISEYAKRSSSEITTLLRYNGTLGMAPDYATKVLKKKHGFSKEIEKTLIGI